MDIRKLDDTFWVAPQIETDRMEALAAAGVRSIISNRPDAEETAQPAFATIEDAARAAGIAVAHVPVVPGEITQADVDAFAAALDRLPGPALGFCKTGKRAATLWTKARNDARSVETVLASAPVTSI